MKKILVTGASGFIGRHVVENIIERGMTPVAFDRNHKNTYPEGTEIFLGDVRDFVAVNEAIALADGVIHLAGVLGTSETIKEPAPAVETNIIGGLNIFKGCYNYGKRASYISVGNYWMNNSYSITKDTAERFAWMFNRELKTEISVVRALNAFGPYQKAQPVRKIIPNFVLPALRDEEITVYGDGSQIMDMIFVEDVADIMVRSLIVEHGQYTHNPVLSSTPNNTKFEAGTGRRTTVQEIAELVIKMVGSGRINNVPMRMGEPEKSEVVGNPETLKPLYEGKTPELTTLEKGLEKTIEYYRNNMEKY